MDRDTLILRNRHMAEAFHTISLQHRIRRMFMNASARLPIALQSTTVNRVLLIRPDHLGDVLLTTPAIRALKRAQPYMEIHALVGSWSADVLANYSEIDVVLTLPFPGFNRNPDTKNALAPYRQLIRSSRELRRIGYSSAVTMRPDHWWGAMLAYFAGIPERIGYQLPEVEAFLTHPIPLHHEHAVNKSLRLVQHWTGEVDPQRATYQFPVEEADRLYITDYLSEWQIPSEQAVICIHPGSGAWAKRWEERKWAKVADTLVDQLDAPLIFTGTNHELPLIQEIASFMRHKPYIIAGNTQVGQLAALYTRALVVLGPDSGPLHLAAAVDAPTVALFGPADPVEFAPWGHTEKHVVMATDIACRPCRVLDWADDNPAYHPCVREITVGQVLDAARRVVYSGNE